MKDLAQELGVSIATVSRALRSSPEIGQDMQVKVKALAKRLNYRPNPFAQSLRKEAPRVIGVVVPNLVTHYYAAVLDGIEELRDQGATIVYTTHYIEEVDRLANRLAILDKGQVIATGTPDELKKMIKKNESITIEVSGLTEKNIADIEAMGSVYSVSYENGILKAESGEGKHVVTDLITFLQKEELNIGNIYSEQPTLNDVFLEITGKELRDE